MSTQKSINIGLAHCALLVALTLGFSSVAKAAKGHDIRRGDLMHIVESQGSVDITWSQSGWPWTRTFKRVMAMQDKHPHGMVPVFIENGYWKRIPRSAGGSFHIQKKMRYGGTSGRIGLIVIDNTKNWIYQERFFNAVPKSWGQWLQDSLNPKDLRKVVDIANSFRSGAKKQALRAFSKLAGKRVAQGLNTVSALIDPTHYYKSWFGTYYKEF